MKKLTNGQTICQTVALFYDKEADFRGEKNFVFGALKSPE
jgi:hypothetical protein